MHSFQQNVANSWMQWISDFVFARIQGLEDSGPFPKKLAMFFENFWQVKHFALWPVLHSFYQIWPTILGLQVSVKCLQRRKFVKFEYKIQTKTCSASGGLYSSRVEKVSGRIVQFHFAGGHSQSDGKYWLWIVEDFEFFCCWGLTRCLWTCNSGIMSVRFRPKLGNGEWSLSPKIWLSSKWIKTYNLCQIKGLIAGRVPAWVHQTKRHSILHSIKLWFHTVIAYLQEISACVTYWQACDSTIETGHITYFTSLDIGYRPSARKQKLWKEQLETTHLQAEGGSWPSHLCMRCEVCMS